MFRVVPGLADSGHFSFECAFAPGWYLCKRGNPLVVARSREFESEEDATFRIVPALTGEPYPAVSIESYASPGLYWQDSGPGDWFGHMMTLDWCGPSSSQESKQAAVFVVHPKPWAEIMGPDSVETPRGVFASASLSVSTAGLLRPLSIAWRVEPRRTARIRPSQGGSIAVISRLGPGMYTVTVSDPFVATVSDTKSLVVNERRAPPGEPPEYPP
jgi:hypothetical protein